MIQNEAEALEVIDGLIYILEEDEPIDPTGWVAIIVLRSLQDWIASLDDTQDDRLADCPL